MRRRNCRIEQRIRFPHVIHIIDAQRCMFEQMCSLVIDLKRVITVEEINVEQFAVHNHTVIQTMRYEYAAQAREWDTPRRGRHRSPIVPDCFSSGD